MEQGAAPAGEVTQASHSGGPGTPPSGHYEPGARSSLDGTAKRLRPEARPREQKSRNGAPGGERPRTQGARRASSARKEWCACRCSIPLASLGRGCCPPETRGAQRRRKETLLSETNPAQPKAASKPIPSRAARDEPRTRRIRSTITRRPDIEEIEDMDEFRYELARRIADFMGRHATCRRKSCRRNGRCTAAIPDCFRDDPPLSKEEAAKALANIRRALDERRRSFGKG